ncbi:hypothetical protein HmCmsJML210_02802 [Escherichia coli]|nr:hypothetical protein HmCmsJML210_02802 [Escherichia coli]
MGNTKECDEIKKHIKLILNFIYNKKNKKKEKKKKKFNLN